MVITRSSLGVALCALLAARSSAQSVGRMVAYDVLHAGGDIVGSWAAPFHSSAKDWLTAGAAVAVSAALMPLDDNNDRRVLDHQQDAVRSALKGGRGGGKAVA